MTAKLKLNTQSIEFLKKYYSDNSNEDLASHLTIIENANSTGADMVTVDVDNVQQYARRLGLKKSSYYNILKSQKPSASERIKHSDAKVVFYFDKPSSYLEDLKYGKNKIVACSNLKQMKSIKNAVYNFNSRKRIETGLHIKMFYDQEEMMILLEPEIISPCGSCRTHSSPEEAVCVPP